LDNVSPIKSYTNNAAYEDAKENDQGRKEESSDGPAEFRASFEEMKSTMVQPMYLALIDMKNQMEAMVKTMAAQGEEIKDLRREAVSNDKNIQMVNINVEALWDHGD
jgi:hypothetical protein